MATKIERVGYPQLNYGNTADYARLGRKFRLPGGKKLHINPRMANTVEQYLAAGGSSLTLGQNQGRDMRNIIPLANRNVFFSNADYIQAGSNGKPNINAMTDAEVRQAVRNIWNTHGGYGCMTSGAQEQRYDNDPFLQTNDWAKYDAIVDEWGKLAQENPGFLAYDTYDGSFNTDVGNMAAVRAALASPQAALNYAISREDKKPYFKNGHYNKIPLLLNQYYRSATDQQKRHTELLTTVEIAQLALQAVNRASNRIMLFCFLDSTEFVFYTGQGYSEHYRHIVPATGGTMTHWGFPTYDKNYHFNQAFVGYDLCDDYYNWEDTAMYGTDPNVILPDYYRESDGFPMIRYEGPGSPQRANPFPQFENRAYPYPTKPVGGEDTAMGAAEMYEIMTTFAGSSSRWARHRTPGGSWCSLDQYYVADRGSNGEAWVRVAGVGDYYWVWVVDYAMGCNPRPLEVDLGTGKTVTLDGENAIELGKANVYLINTNA